MAANRRLVSEQSLPPVLQLLESAPFPASKYQMINVLSLLEEFLRLSPQDSFQNRTELVSAFQRFLEEHSGR